MKKTSYIFVAAMIALSFSATTAFAEDGNAYGSGTQVAQPQGYDSQYVVPPSYQGQYYPQEQQSAVGYYGTEQTSDNSNHIADEEAYNLYYY